MSNIHEAFEAFKRIGSTTSRLAKEAIVAEQAENHVFNELVLRTYDPFRMYFVKKLPPITQVNINSEDNNYRDFLILLTKLMNRQVTGHAALSEIQQLFSGMTHEEQQWYSRVLQKDLKIGMTSSTFNKVHADLETDFQIPTFSCALANTYSTKKMPSLWALEPKLDGYRCLAFRYENHVELRSRNGKLIEGYTSIEQAVMAFEAGTVYDGEIMGETGLFSEMQKYAMKKDMDDKPGIFHMFDAIRIEEFFTGTSVETYTSRRARLETAFENANAESSPVLKLVPVVVYGSIVPEEGMTEAEARAKAEETIMTAHRQLLAEGYEGSMLKDIKGRYECKRSWNIQKVKDFDNVDLLVIGVEPGKAGTQFENTLGSLVVDYKGYTVNVGSGFTPEQRDEIWKNKGDIINRIIEVKYFEETKDKKGNLSLRFPIFVQIRYDKE